MGGDAAGAASAAVRLKRDLAPVVFDADVKPVAAPNVKLRLVAVSDEKKGGDTLKKRVHFADVPSVRSVSPRPQKGGDEGRPLSEEDSEAKPCYRPLLPIDDLFDECIEGPKTLSSKLTSEAIEHRLRSAAESFPKPSDAAHAAPTLLSSGSGPVAVAPTSSDVIKGQATANRFMPRLLAAIDVPCEDSQPARASPSVPSQLLGQPLFEVPERDQPHPPAAGSGAALPSAAGVMRGRIRRALSRGLSKGAPSQKAAAGGAEGVAIERTPSHEGQPLALPQTRSNAAPLAPSEQPIDATDGGPADPQDTNPSNPSQAAKAASVKQPRVTAAKTPGEATSKIPPPRPATPERRSPSLSFFESWAGGGPLTRPERLSEAEAHPLEGSLLSAIAKMKAPSPGAERDRVSHPPPSAAVMRRSFTSPFGLESSPASLQLKWPVTDAAIEEIVSRGGSHAAALDALSAISSAHLSHRLPTVQVDEGDEKSPRRAVLMSEMLRTRSFDEEALRMRLRDEAIKVKRTVEVNHPSPPPPLSISPPL